MSEPTDGTIGGGDELLVPGSEDLGIVDVDAALDEELADEKPQSVQADTKAEGYGTTVVTVDGKDFEIGEPTVDIVLRIIKVFAGLAIRGEKVALRNLADVAKKPTLSARVVLFGALAAFSTEDVIALGSAVLQFPDDREGRKWLREHKLTLNPILRAFFLNLSQSDDLRESVDSFFVGLEMASSFLEATTKRASPKP